MPHPLFLTTLGHLFLLQTLPQLLFKLLAQSLLVLLLQVGVVTLTQAQTSITLRGRAVYSIGEPAAGATVTLTKTASGGQTTQTTTAGGDGNYSFQSEPGCADYDVQAVSSEIVDGEPLPPSNKASISGCISSNMEFGDLLISKPHPIALGGHVRDQFGSPVQGVTVTMTRTKSNPVNVTTATMTTDGSGHYQFNTFSRCSVTEEFNMSINGVALPGATSVSGCVLSDYPELDMTVSFNRLEDAGENSCNKEVPRPVNVTNGNMYLQQTDFRLPGVGEAIAITRTYNSISQNSGLFGRGWMTTYDETVTTGANNQLQLTLSDGRLVTYATPDFYGQILKNWNGTYTVTFKDRRVHQFSAAGKLLSLTDRNGNQTLLTYDVNGKISSITDAFARVLTVTTNAGGRVTSLSDALGTISTYTYGGSDELLTVTYADNSAYQFSYVSVPLGLALATVTDALGNTVEHHDYDTQGRATTSETHGGVERYALNYVSATETDVTDALGHITKYFFHRIKGRKAVSRVEGNCSCGSSQVQSWTYDNQLNVTSTTNALNQTTSSTYDTNGNLLTESDSLGTSTFTYNQFGEVLTVTDVMGGVTEATYDSQGNLLSLKDALNNTTVFSHDLRGQLLDVTDARSNMLSFSYDSGGNLAQRRDAFGNLTNFAYDARGRLVSARDALNNATTYSYDAAGRIIKIIRPDGSFITYTYDPAGRRIKVTDALNNSTSFAYDGAYRLTSKTDAAGNSSRYSYDLMSNVTAKTDELGHNSNFEYDDFNRLKKVIYPAATTGGTRLQENIEYDAVGNITKRTDQAGRLITFEYDGANRLLRVTDPALQITQYEYDARSETTAVVDAIGQRYTFDYDALGRVTRTTRAGLSMSFGYDPVGNLIQRTDYKNLTTSYTYDKLNRLTKITYPDATLVTYGYDKLSRLTTATNINGTVSLTYDSRGRLLSTVDVFGQAINYNYDANSNRTKTSLGATTNATYLYDALNRPTKLTDGGGQVVGFAYDAASKLVSRALPNGITTTYQYDGLDRLTRLRDAKGASTLADNQYSYNSVNNLIQNLDQAGTHNYSYDSADRLLTATYPNTAAESYAYDSVGNRTSSHRSTTYNYQPFNRLVNTSTASYFYDNNGNVIARWDSTGATQFAWDFENRLLQVVTSSAGGVSYKYDALGRRIQRVPSSGASTSFIYDGQDVVQDRNSDGSVVDYLNGPGIDNKIRQKSSAGVFYFVKDHLGGTTALTDTRARIVERIAYDSFGNSTGSTRTRYGYTGRERDSLTGLLYYRARWYDAQLGRFLSEDPIGLSGGINSFAYVGNNPQGAKDPFGLYEIDVHYYLTYYLAIHSGCFSSDEASQIAHGDQHVDEDPGTKPGFGGNTPVVDPRSDHRQQQVNIDYHALHGGSHQPYLDMHWSRSISGYGSLYNLGIFFHYLQDTYSHRGFTDPLYGHSPAHGGSHADDKTDTDPGKAIEMARATLDQLNRFAKEKLGRCHCQDGVNWDVIRRFVEAPAGNAVTRRLYDIEHVDPWYLNTKIQILGVPRR